MRSRRTAEDEENTFPLLQQPPALSFVFAGGFARRKFERFDFCPRRWMALSSIADRACKSL
jgi:hypothetical protein